MQLTGVFDEATSDAVARWQKRRKLPLSGMFGPRSLEQLREEERLEKAAVSERVLANISDRMERDTAARRKFFDGITGKTKARERAMAAAVLQALAAGNTVVGSGAISSSFQDGSTSEPVLALQNYLSVKECLPPKSITGVYDGQTFEGIIAWQRLNNVEQTGSFNLACLEILKVEAGETAGLPDIVEWDVNVSLKRPDMNYYDALELNENALMSHIKSAYEAKVKALRPSLYTICAGDSLSIICSRFNIDEARLSELNPELMASAKPEGWNPFNARKKDVKSLVLRAGDVLRIPDSRSVEQVQADAAQLSFVEEAYSVLGDADERRAYDHSLRLVRKAEKAKARGYLKKVKENGRRKWWRALPFVVGGMVVVVASALLVSWVRARRRRDNDGAGGAAPRRDPISLPPPAPCGVDPLLFHSKERCHEVRMSKKICLATVARFYLHVREGLRHSQAIIASKKHATEARDHLHANGELAKPRAKVRVETVVHGALHGSLHENEAGDHGPEHESCASRIAMTSIDRAYNAHSVDDMRRSVMRAAKLGGQAAMFSLLESQAKTGDVIAQESVQESAIKVGRHAVVEALNNDQHACELEPGGLLFAKHASFSAMEIGLEESMRKHAAFLVKQGGIAFAPDSVKSSGAALQLKISAEVSVSHTFAAHSEARVTKASRVVLEAALREAIPKLVQGPDLEMQMSKISIDRWGFHEVVREVAGPVTKIAANMFAEGALSHVGLTDAEAAKVHDLLQAPELVADSLAALLGTEDGKSLRHVVDANSSGRADQASVAAVVDKLRPAIATCAKSIVAQHMRAQAAKRKDLAAAHAAECGVRHTLDILQKRGGAAESSTLYSTELLQEAVAEGIARAREKVLARVGIDLQEDEVEDVLREAERGMRARLFKAYKGRLEVEAPGFLTQLAIDEAHLEGDSHLAERVSEGRASPEEMARLMEASLDRARMVHNAEGIAEENRMATKVQALARARSVRRQLEASHEAATDIQKWYRGNKVRKDLLQKNEAALKIQTAVRAHAARKELEVLKAEALRAAAAEAEGIESEPASGRESPALPPASPPSPPAAEKKRKAASGGCCSAPAVEEDDA